MREGMDWMILGTFAECYLAGWLNARGLYILGLGLFSSAPTAAGPESGPKPRPVITSPPSQPLSTNEAAQPWLQLAILPSLWV